MEWIVEGEVGLRVEIWRTAMKDDVRAVEMARLQRELEARAADASKGAGLRQLRQIMVRIMKGEVGMRVEIWRTAVKMDAHAKHRELQAALEAQMQAQGQVVVRPRHLRARGPWMQPMQPVRPMMQPMMQPVRPVRPVAQ